MANRAMMVARFGEWAWRTDERRTLRALRLTRRLGAPRLSPGTGARAGTAHGVVDDLRVYSRLLTAGEIAALAKQ